ncbi:MAG: hypothetical protein ACD_39C01218G0003 [uncultured bacterium]|nr:MAG: hypothetical protein ACD_39C01218G0003 [uncultured bacterium]
MKKLFLILILIGANLCCIHAVTAKTALPSIAPDGVVGTVSYYRWRYNDFIQRHPQFVEPDPKNIPDYYLDYGEKYAIRFTDELYPELSNREQKWLIIARLNLQLIIENRCQSNPEAFARLEENPRAFRRFAFDTHPIAYMDAGLSGLPLSDLIKIGLTPDLRDILTKNGSLQVISISGKLGKDYLKRVFRFIRRTSELVCNAVRNGQLAEAEQVVSFIEGLSPAEKKVVFLITGNCRQFRQEIQFKLGHKEGSQKWEKLLERISRLDR